MRETPVCTAADAIYKLAAGNLKYLNAEKQERRYFPLYPDVHLGEGPVALRHHRHLFGFPGRPGEHLLGGHR